MALGVRLGRRGLLAGAAAVSFADGARARSGPPVVAYVSGYLEGFDIDALYRNAIIAGFAAEGFEAPAGMTWLDRHPKDDLDRAGRAAVVQAMTRELVALGVDLIVTNGASALAVVDAAAGQVPVVYGYSGDPIVAGLASALATPRGNATGVTMMMYETNAKRIQLLKQIVPGARRLALVCSPNHPGEAGEVEVCRRTVGTIGVELLYKPVTSSAEVQSALTELVPAGIDAIVSLPDGTTNPNRKVLAQWALDKRVPYVSGWSFHAESGALMSYGTNVEWSYRRVGYFGARVLRGARPADMPIEQPTRFELVLNQKTARAIGIKLPDNLLAQADSVIE